jgi:hypothetical protein
MPSFPWAQQVRYVLGDNDAQERLFNCLVTPLGLASSRPTSDNRWQDEVSRFCSTGPINQGRG